MRVRRRVHGERTAFGRRARAGAAILAGALLAAGAVGAPERGTEDGSRVSAPARPERPAAVRRARFLMGAPLVIEAAGGDAAAAIERAFDEVARLDGVLSNWRDDSELAGLNRRAAAEPVGCSRDLYGAVEAALRWAEATGGAFDPTVEPLVRRFELRGPEGMLPGTRLPEGDPESAAGAAALVGWRHVHLDPERRSVRFDRPGMGIDLGGIGKGLALDAAARVLARAGVSSALLDFGGQLLALGEGPDGGGWRVAIADPLARDEAAATLLLSRGSISTSGNSERSVRGATGGSVGHILDPASGRPAPGSFSVTAVAADGASADALSTALFVMGPERGRVWAEARGIPVLYVRGDGDRPALSATGAWARLTPSDGGERR